MGVYTIIFRGKRFPVTDNITVEYLTSIIKKDSTEYEYFGEFIDNPFDFEVDEEYNDYVNAHTFITMNFDTKEDIDYINTDAKKFFIDYIQNKNIRIESEGKDIEVICR